MGMAGEDETLSISSTVKIPIILLGGASQIGLRGDVSGGIINSA